MFFTSRFSICSFSEYKKRDFFRFLFSFFNSNATPLSIPPHNFNFSQSLHLFRFSCFRHLKWLLFWGNLCLGYAHQAEHRMPFFDVQITLFSRFFVVVFGVVVFCFVVVVLVFSRGVVSQVGGGKKKIATLTNTHTLLDHLDCCCLSK